MAKLKKINPLKMLIEGRTTSELPRPYLGMSQLGGTCTRQLWYSFRWCYVRVHTPKQKRIFERGDLEEPRIIKDLESIGVKVSGDQTELVGFAGHCKGHVDAILENVPPHPSKTLLGEFKTANMASFKTFADKGCKIASPRYYTQCQVYMKYLKLDYCLFIVTNKNNEERHYEIIPYNETAAQAAEDVAIDVIQAEEPPPKIGGPTWFECKFCDAYDICHYNEEIHRCCRNCAKVQIKPEGVWYCTKYNRNLDHAEQSINRTKRSCYIPLLVPEQSS